jgi:hypothetical protein
MNQPSTLAPTGSKTRKLVLQLIFGAVTGGAVTFLTLNAIEGSGFDLENPSRVFALLVGLVFILMGLFVGLGAAIPGLGSRLLNVEDEDELRDLQKPLWRSAAVVLLIGAMMLVLALAEAGDWSGLVSARAAAIVILACVLGTCLLSYIGRNDNDELMRSIAREGSAWAMYACLAVFTVWGSLAHLGYAPWITPLGMVSAMLAILLVAIFAVCGVRGVLKVR